MLKTNATNAGMEKAVSKSRKNKNNKNDHIKVSVGRSTEILQENSKNTLDRKTNTLQKTNETKVIKNNEYVTCVIFFVPFKEYDLTVVFYVRCPNCGSLVSAPIGPG